MALSRGPDEPVCAINFILRNSILRNVHFVIDSIYVKFVYVLSSPLYLSNNFRVYNIQNLIGLICHISISQCLCECVEYQIYRGLMRLISSFEISCCLKLQNHHRTTKPFKILYDVNIIFLIYTFWKVWKL